jgi:hypothetical protein
VLNRLHLHGTWYRLLLIDYTAMTEHACALVVLRRARESLAGQVYVAG